MEGLNKHKTMKEEKASIKEEIIPQEHKSIDIITKEKQININIQNFSSSLSDIFTELKKATNDYCVNINKIIDKLNISNNDNNDYYESKIANYIYEMFQFFVETVTELFANIENESVKIDNESSNLEKNLEELSQTYLSYLDKMECNKKIYHREFNNFELDLIKEQISQKEKELENKEEKINENDVEKDIKHTINIDDNFSGIKSIQNMYLNTHKQLKSELLKIFELINIKRNLLLKIIHDNFLNFLSHIHNVGEMINKRIDVENSSQFTFQNDDYLKEIEEKVNNIFDDEIYQFKYLSKFNTIIDEDRGKLVKAENNSDDLLDKLDDNDIEIITEKIEKYNIQFNNKSKHKIELIKTNKIIKGYAISIINTPEKFTGEEKESLFSLLKSSTDNQFLFVQYLNNYRGIEKFIFNSQTVKILCEIFEYILNLAFEGKIFKLIQLSIILSQTYYHENDNKSNEKEKENSKIYIIHYLKKLKLFKEKNFWKIYLEGIIEEEKKKSKANNTHNISEKQMSMIVYFSILTLTKNMIDCGLDMEFMTTITNEAFDTYNLPDNLKKDIINYLIVELQAP